ncbi:MFS transporter [Amycolatopsis acidiphila]|uniref:MFS transporter n=1 Tax=Amycolatopsis acidiphila TaxID=715473 RepID=A0A558AF98_9PSEU|nr:MFS transporter [Amycolatopsis acidiphila]TVT22937.1 MFS transporter [Amycolatopsis acidiphila]UIJ57097.1 MFS transporter [Amycolatopsis acidiphila]GHG53373.1 MFS transporter [Amycolatopsis acidiphila]
MGLPAVLRSRDFDLYWGGVVVSQIGTRGAVAANLFQVFVLTGSTAEVGLVGLAQLVALVVLSPLGGVLADRLDRRRLLQWTQVAALVVSAALAVVTIAGAATVWMVVLAALLSTAAATFDQPARQALIPALVLRERLVDAFALLNPSRELAVLIGPALSGVFIAVWGVGSVYVFDAVTYAVLVATLAIIKVPPLVREGKPPRVWESLREGAAYVRRRTLIWQLMGLDLAATVFGAYRVLLPALALDRLHVGATGYGLLSAAPSAGALLGSVFVFRIVRSRRSGLIVLISTAAYGVVVVGFAQAAVFGLSLVLAGLLGVADALATTVRHATVQVETPDGLRGRVSAIYQMASRGGPALGDSVIGAAASALGPVGALTLGGLVPLAASIASFVAGPAVRSYRVVPQQEPEEQAAA